MLRDLRLGGIHAAVGAIIEAPLCELSIAGIVCVVCLVVTRGDGLVRAVIKAGPSIQPAEGLPEWPSLMTAESRAHSIKQQRAAYHSSRRSRRRAEEGGTLWRLP